METIWLTIYFLIWPVVVAGTLFVIVRAFYRDWKESRREGRDMI